VARRIGFFDGAESSTTPTIGNIVASGHVEYANDAAFEAAEQGAPTQGNIYYNTTDNCIRYYNGTTWTVVVDETKAQTLQNKTIDGTDATGNNAVSIDADDASYDNTVSGLSATDVKAALDEIDQGVDDLNTLSGVAKNVTDLGVMPGSTVSDNTTIQNAVSEIDSELDNKEDTANKGANNGYAPLDGGGKVPAANLPSTLMSYLGNWVASTNTPTLADGVGTNGDVYKATDSGTVDFGSGNISFDANDQVIYNGTIWEKSDNSDAVTSVNTQFGAVVLDTDDILEGTNKYESQQASAPEITAATETALRSHSPADIKSYIDQHGGAGSGEGGINYVKNPNAEEDTSDTGTSNANVTISRSTTASTNIRGVAKYSVGFNASVVIGDYAEFDCNSIDNFDKGRALNVSMEYAIGPNYTAEEYQVVLRDLTNNVDLTIDDGNEGKLLAAGSTLFDMTKFTGRVVLPDTNNDYSVRIVSTVNRSNSNIIHVDSIKFSPDVIVPGAIVENTKDYVPTLAEVGTGAYTLNHGRFTRIGQNYFIQVRFNVDTAFSGGGTFTVSLPDEITSPKNLETGAVSFYTPGTGYKANIGASISGNNIRIKKVGTGGVLPGTDLVIGSQMVIDIWVQDEDKQASGSLSTTETLISTAKVEAYRSSNQTFTTGVVADIIFDTISEENGGTNFNVSTGEYTVPKRGWYFPKVQVLTEALAATATIETRILKNGLNIALDRDTTSLTNNTRSLDASILTFCEKGDVLKADFFHNIGINLDLLGGAALTNFSVMGMNDLSVFSTYGEGGSVIVEDDGNQVTNKATKLNFAGAGVTITEPVDNEVTIDIPATLGSGSFDPTSTDQWVGYFEDFLGYVSGTWGNPWGLQVLNSGALNVSRDITVGEKATVCGAIGMGTGTAGGNYTALRGGPAFYADQFEWELYYKMLMNIVPDGTDDYLVAFGLWDDTFIYSGAANGALFLIDRTVNSTNIIARTSNAGADTDTDTGIAFNSDWSTFRIKYDATDIKFYIDGALVATHNTNIPISDDLRFHIYQSNVAGATSRFVYYDWVGFRYKALNARGTW
jgi:hypothetical protein